MVKPDGFEDIVAINALWRPGPMRSNAHFDYADIKHGKKKPQYDYMLKSVTDNTYGLYVYQEQIMKATHVLGKLTLAESDEVRTVMKKFDKAKMATFKDKFIKGAIENGCPEKKASVIWDKLERFSGYGFNKSHSAAYGLMTYWCAWFKTHYPEEFYTSSLNFSQDEIEVIQILDEIESRKLRLKVYPPDINRSNESFYTDVVNSLIYWSLTKIKGLGDKSVAKIMEVRKSGEFLSVYDFIERMKGTGIGVGAARNLIIAGCFDEVENLDEPKDRRDLLKSTYKTNKELIGFEEKYPIEITRKNYVWTYEQKALTGFGKVDYKGLLRATNPKLPDLYLNPDEFLITEAKNKKSVLAGRIVSWTERSSKRGKFGILQMECNNKMMRCVMWSDVWDEAKDHIEKAKKTGGLVAIIGKIGYDDYAQCNALYSDSEITRIIDL
jgi:DNA polymerase-3 subunit alpha